MSARNLNYSKWQCTFSKENLKEGFSANPRAELWFDDLYQILPLYEITSRKRISLFLSQVGVEAGELKQVIENLNYSQSGLRKVFPKYFPSDSYAQQYAGQPEKIANKVYANRLGNGPESSGDGYKYRGRGLIQITGKYNYGECSKFMYDGNINTLLDNPGLLTTVSGAIHSCCWYWTKTNLNWCADNEMVTNARKKINGGSNGLQESIRLFNVFMRLIKEDIKR